MDADFQRDVALIRENLRHENGVLWWTKRGGPARRMDRPVGTKHTDGYLQFQLGGKSFLAHRVVWALEYGIIPSGQIDHIDGNPSNNAPSNLRLATGSQNKANIGTPRNNTSGAKGVFWDAGRRKWRAAVWKSRKRFHLGMFSEFDDAVAAYNKAAQEMHGEFARINTGNANGR